MTQLPLLLLGCLLFVSGCGGGPAFGDLHGDVSLDGNPLKEGVIRFNPVDGSSPTASALIVDGKYTARVPVTKHRVEISAPKLPKGFASSKQLKRGTVDEDVPLEELIPQRYNLRSELTVDVKAGKQEVPFRLQTK